jgi:hypothetical protein
VCGLLVSTLKLSVGNKIDSIFYMIYAWEPLLLLQAETLERLSSVYHFVLLTSPRRGTVFTSLGGLLGSTSWTVTFHVQAGLWL